MKESMIAELTLKDDTYACALADKIISESQETDEWYEYFDDFASLLGHPKSLVRNRALIYQNTREVCFLQGQSQNHTAGREGVYQCFC